MDPAELVDMVTSDAPSSEISDYIKGLLHTKASEKVNSLKPEVAAGLFGAEYEDDYSTEAQEEE